MTGVSRDSVRSETAGISSADWMASSQHPRCVWITPLETSLWRQTFRLVVGRKEQGWNVLEVSWKQLHHFYTTIAERYPDFDMAHLPSFFEKCWYVRAGQTVESAMRGLLKVCAHQQGTPLQHEICELMHSFSTGGALVVSSPVPRSVTRAARSAGSALLSMIPKKRYDVILKGGADYEPAADYRIEKDCCAALLSGDQAKLAGLATNMTKSSFGEKGSSYKLDYTSLDKQGRSLIGKQSVPVQVYYKLPRDNEWNLGYLLVQDHRVSFAKGFQDLSNDHMNWDTSFVMHGANVGLIDDAFAHIVVERKCYIDTLMIALRFNHPGDKQSPFRSDRYQFVSTGLEALFHQLNMASAKEVPIDETEVIENCGLSKFVFRSVKFKLISTEITEMMKSSHVYVQIKAPPFTEYVRVALQDTEFPPNLGSSASPFPGGTFSWQPASNPQERVSYIPINNWFRKFDLSLVMCKGNPYLPSSKVVPLGSWSLLNYDVLRSSSRVTKKHSEEIIRDLDKSIKEAFIEYKTQNASSFWSYLIDPNKNNYMEGRKFLQEDLNFVKSEIKVGVFRFRRIICEIEGWSELFMEIFRVKYFKWTVFITVLFHIFLLYADMNSLHQYFLFLICLIIGLSHRTSVGFMTERVFPLLRNPKDLNPDYWEPIVHTKTYLKDHRFLQIELLRKKLQPAEGIISDLKLIKMVLHMGPTFMHKIANMFEKIKNLLTWYETRRTKALVFVLIISVLIFHVLSFKLVILAGYWAFLSEQSRYYKSHLKRNREVATKVLEHIIAKNFEKYNPMKFDKEFPFLTNETEFANFRKKMIQKIEKHLDIELPNGLVQGMSKLDDLVYLLASTNEELKVLDPQELGIPADFGRKQSDKKSQQYTVGGFIASTPSDYFDILYNS